MVYQSNSLMFIRVISPHLSNFVVFSTRRMACWPLLGTKMLLIAITDANKCTMKKQGRKALWRWDTRYILPKKSTNCGSSSPRPLTAHILRSRDWWNRNGRWKQIKSIVNKWWLSSGELPRSLANFVMTGEYTNYYYQRYVGTETISNQPSPPIKILLCL